MSRNPSIAQRARWLWDTLDRTIKEFEGVGETEFDMDWGLQRKAHGCLAAIGQDLPTNTALASPELSGYCRDLRNKLSHDYMAPQPAVLWGALQRLPELRKSIEQHVPPSVLEQDKPRQPPEQADRAEPADSH